MSDNEALYSYQGAHRFMPLGELVAIVVRLHYGFEVQGGSEEDRLERIDREVLRPLTAGACRVSQVKIGARF